MKVTTATPYRSLDIASAKALAQDVLARVGLPKFVADHGLCVDCSESTMDEHGLDVHGQPDPRLDNLMQRGVDLTLGMAAATDPNQQAQGVVFSAAARLGGTINLNNYHDWVSANRLPREEMTTTNMSAALCLLLEAAATELGTPELATLTQFVDHSLTAKDPAQRVLTPNNVIVLPRPYVITVLTDGDPDDFDSVEALVRAMSFAAVRLNLVYISNQQAGLAPLRALVKIHSRYTDNVNLVDLSRYPRGLRDVGDRELMELLAAGLATWDDELADKEMLATA